MHSKSPPPPPVVFPPQNSSYGYTGNSRSFESATSLPGNNWNTCSTGNSLQCTTTTNQPWTGETGYRSNNSHGDPSGYFPFFPPSSSLSQPQQPFDLSTQQECLQGAFVPHGIPRGSTVNHHGDPVAGSQFEPGTLPSQPQLWFSESNFGNPAGSNTTLVGQLKGTTHGFYGFGSSVTDRKGFLPPNSFINAGFGGPEHSKSLAFKSQGSASFQSNTTISSVFHNQPQASLYTSPICEDLPFGTSDSDSTRFSTTNTSAATIQLNNCLSTSDPKNFNYFNNSLNTDINFEPSTAHFKHSSPISIDHQSIDSLSQSTEGSTVDQSQFHNMVQYPYKPTSQSNYGRYTTGNSFYQNEFPDCLNFVGSSNAVPDSTSFPPATSTMGMPRTTAEYNPQLFQTSNFNTNDNAVITNNYYTQFGASNHHNLQRVPVGGEADTSFGSNQSGSSTNHERANFSSTNDSSMKDSMDIKGDQFLVPTIGGNSSIDRIRIELADSSCSSPMTSEFGGVADSNSSNSYLIGGLEEDSAAEAEGISSDEASGDLNDDNDISDTPVGRNSGHRRRNGPGPKTPAEQSAKQRHKANMRERSRMNKINKGFETLRVKLNDQTYPYEKKLSKVDTLRMAIRYIQDLTDMLKEQPAGGEDGLDDDGRPSAASIKRKMALQKVFINYRGSDLEKSLLGMANVHRLALSWGRSGALEGGQHRSSSAAIRTAKIWTPKKEQPEENPTNSEKDSK